MKEAFLPHVAARVFNAPLLITRTKLDAIVSALGRRVGVDEGDVEPELAMAARRDAPPAGPGGVAVIGVYNTLVHRALGLRAMSGLTSYEQIRAQFREALANPEIETILFDIYSPGGEVSGAFDLADEIYKARGQKRIIAVANEIALSGAYLLASSAERIYLPRTGEAGSIGVIMLHTDQSSFDESMGVKYTAIFAGARKNDFSPHAALSPEALEIGSQEVNGLYDLFVETVARNMGLDPARVRATEAGIFRGEDAVRAGLAHEIASFPEVLDMLAKKGGKKIMTLTELKEKHPEIYAAAMAEGARDAEARLSAAALKLDQERTQIKAEAEEAASTARKEGFDEGFSRGKEAGAADERQRVTEILGAEADPAQTLDAVKDGIGADAAYRKFYQADRDARKQGLVDLKETLSGSAGAAPRQKQKTSGGGADFMAEVKRYQQEHGCRLAAAVRAVQKMHPELHTAWLESQKQKVEG